jgi:hypothetical protein
VQPWTINAGFGTKLPFPRLWLKGGFRKIRTFIMRRAFNFYRQRFSRLQHGHRDAIGGPEILEQSFPCGFRE